MRNHQTSNIKGMMKQRPPSVGLEPGSNQWNDQERRYQMVEDRRHSNASKNNSKSPRR